MTTFRAQLLEGHQYTTIATTGKHALLFDKTEGDNFGPSPWEAFILSIGACVVVTVLAYARLKEYDVRGITVDVDHDREKTEEHPEGVDIFRKTVTIQGRLSEAERERLLEISKRCPVQRCIVNQPRFEETLAVVP